MEQKIDYNISEQLLKKTNNDFNKVSSFMSKLNKTTDQIHEVGFNLPSMKKPDFISNLSKIQKSNSELDKFYKKNFWEIK